MNWRSHSPKHVSLRTCGCDPSMRPRTLEDARAGLQPKEDVMNTEFNLQQYELTVAEVHHNLSPSQLYEHAIRYEKDASIADNGALVAYSGVKTGRSPKDKRIVKDPKSEANV